MPKVDELHLLCHSEPGVICVVETWLCDEIANSEIFSDYSVVRLDMNRHGGGVAFLFHQSSFKVLLRGGPHNLEFLATSISTAPMFQPICICLFYCPPSSPVVIFDHLCSTLLSVNPAHFAHFVLIGDFNVDYSPDHPLFYIIY